jgi:hypothetical protein
MLHILRRVEEPVKDLRIEIANFIRTEFYALDDYGNRYKEVRKNSVGNNGAFKVVATDNSDYDGMEVTVFVSSHATWTSAEKSLKAKAQELSFDERAKAFDRMISEREDGLAIQKKRSLELSEMRKQNKKDTPESTRKTPLKTKTHYTTYK